MHTTADDNGLRANARFVAALTATSVRAALADRGAFLMRAGLMVLNNGIFFTFWVVLLSRVPTIRGYALGDVAVLYGIVAVAHGLAVFFAGGMEQLARTIDDGDLDALLSQPKPTLVYVLGMRAQPSGLGDLVSGLLMIALSGRVTLLSMPIIALAAAAATIVLVSSAVILHSAAFWLGRTNTASRQLYEATLLFSLYPDTLFGGPVRLALFTIFPGAFVGYLPSRLIRAPSLSIGIAVVGAAVIYGLAARRVFQLGLRSYSSGSRFVTFG
jgi:ABC-2 type transport system permease protein